MNQKDPASIVIMTTQVTLTDDVRRVSVSFVSCGFESNWIFLSVVHDQTWCSVYDESYGMYSLGCEEPRANGKVPLCDGQRADCRNRQVDRNMHIHSPFAK